MERSVILYIISRMRRGISRTRLMKLLFIADVLAKDRLGRRLVGGEWVRWYFGPFNKHVLDVLDELFEEGLIDIVREDPGVFYVSLEEPPRLGRDVRALLDEVIKEYGFMKIDELLDTVYERWRVSERRLGEVMLSE